MLFEMSPGIRIYFTVLAFVLGTVLGSFINCLAWRKVHGESVWKGRSHCAVCGHMLTAADLIPVFSYLFLRGKCRYCGEKISPRYMLTEVFLGFAFLGVFLKYGFSVETLRYFGFTGILLAVSLVDLESYEIPDSFLLSGVIWWAVTIPLLSWQYRQTNGIFSVKAELLRALPGGFLIAGGLLGVSLLFDKILGKESMGGGDIKLIFVTGLYLGPWGNLLTLILSCVIGLIFVAAMKQKKTPFGPSISLASYLCLLFGSRLISWYLGLIGL